MTKILVIDDQNDLREDVIEMLHLENFEAYGAANGRDGIDFARQHKPDLIVCDITMPEMDGYEVLAEIRKDMRTATIPFIFLSARTDRVNMRSGMVLGADDYITKPFLIDELMDSINSQLKKRSEFKAIAEKRLQMMQESIITSLPHELRTPLNTIIGFSDMLLTEAQRLKPDQVAEWASHIQLAAHRLLRLVENYLFYTRLQVTKEDAELQRDIEFALIEHGQLIIQDQANRTLSRSERTKDTTFELAEAPPLHIQHADLKKIVEELADNAAKFSKEGQPITIKGQVEDNAYVLTITDAGHGIKAEAIDNIGAYIQFERWFHEQQGMGLGLAIVKQIIELYGGVFSIHGSEGEGTTATIRIPLAE